MSNEIDRSSDGVVQFWMGQSIIFGCLECERAAHLRKHIDHLEDCSVKTDLDRSEESGER